MGIIIYAQLYSMYSRRTITSNPNQEDADEVAALVEDIEPKAPGTLQNRV